MNNALLVLLVDLDMTEERISELGDMSVGTAKTEKQREQRL